MNTDENNHPIPRREMLVATAAAIAVGPISILTADAQANPIGVSKLKYCLNTSTIHGEVIPIVDQVTIAQKAGYDAIEIWLRDVDAVREISREVAEGKLSADAITESTISEHLYTRNLPDPDLLIRTSGELRISNFLLWQISYSEIWITPKAWPEFGKPELCEAVFEFVQRDRRFGGLT